MPQAGVRPPAAACAAGRPHPIPSRPRASRAMPLARLAAGTSLAPSPVLHSGDDHELQVCHVVSHCAKP